MGDLRQTHEWAMFLGGHWQKEMPDRAGEYSVVDYDGDLLRREVRWSDLGRKFMCLGRQDVAWWWSEPTPELPKPPPWGVGAVHQ